MLAAAMFATNNRAGCVTGILMLLLVLLNVGEVISLVINVTHGHARWLGDLLVAAVLNAIGFYLLRLARED